MPDSRPAQIDTRSRAALLLFEQILDVPEDRRTDWLVEHCAEDRALLAEVERLLRRDSTQGALPELAEVVDLADVFAPGASAAQAPGTRIGDFEIVRPIAEGGMGRVFEALQSQPERRVALKILRVAFTGPEARRRFTYEAEILARLQHPSIAQVYAAGLHVQDGEQIPFFAMEFVEGARDLVRYAREQKLDRRARLELLATVCDAVHYGHQKGVVHRDLKPANILVGADGAPKIIDYGVARASHLEPEIAPEIATIRTRAGEVLGTLPYMSPEQLDGDIERLDTRTDVYSLGVLLCELLCGELPHQLEGKALLEAARTLRETPPRRPSEVDPTVDPDLDVICLRALRTEPDERYGSAAEFAGDLRRFLRGETILARPPSTWYVARKFAARHKLVVLVGSALVASLVIGLATTTHFYRELKLSSAGELAARRDAERRLIEVRDLAGTLVFELNEDLRALGGSTPLRKKIVERGLAAIMRLEPESDGDPAFQLELARAFLAIGALQGHPGGANLGDRVGALASYGKGLALLEELARGAASSAVIQRYLADGLRASAGILVHDGDLDEAALRYERAIALCANLEGNVEPLSVEADAHDGLSDLLMRRGDHELAAVHAEEALRLRRAVLELDPGDVLSVQMVAKAIDQSGRTYAANGDLDRAEEEHLRSRALLTAALGRVPDDARLMEGLGFCLHSLGQVHMIRLSSGYDAGRAEALLEVTSEDLELMRKLLAADPTNANYRTNYAAALGGYGNACHVLKMPECLAAFQEALELAEERLGENPDSLREQKFLSSSLGKVAMGLQLVGRSDEALAAFERAREYAETLSAEYPRNAAVRRGSFVGNRNAGVCHQELARDERRDRATRIADWTRALEYYGRGLQALESMRDDGLIYGFDLPVIGELEDYIGEALDAIDELEADLE